MEDFMQLMTAHGLVALNTWDTRRPCYTYEFNHHRTQIDYVLVRRGQADQPARHLQPLAEFAVGAARGGPQHRPLLASLRANWGPPLSSQQPGQRIDRERAIKEASNPALAKRLANVIRGTACRAEPNAADINVRAGEQIFPTSPQSPQLQPWQDPSLQSTVRDMSQLFREMRCRTRSLTWREQMFQAWRSWAKFQRLFTLHKKCRAKLRRQRLQAQLDAAKQAADRNDARALYGIVRRLAPKQAKRGIHLRAADGSLLSPAEELKAFQQHFQERFRAGTAEEMSYCSQQLMLSQPYNLTQAEIENQLRKTPARKAVPAMSAPTILKLAASHIAELTALYLQTLWQPGHAMWKDAWLSLLPKPGKNGSQPEHYRPIGLQCPLGKAVVAAVLERAKPRIHRHMQNYPQHAYLPGKSCNTAIQAAYRHCNTVRQRLACATRTLHKRQGRVPPKAQGGLMVSLDLAQAFDKVPRSLLTQGLARAGGDSDTAVLLLAWHTDSKLHLQRGTNDATVTTSRGARQGCCAAPLLWCVYASLLCDRMNARLGA